MKGWQTFDLKIAVRAPIMCQGLDAAMAGLDTAMMRDEQGRPIIPGDHVKGLLRAFFRVMYPEDEIRVFGPPVDREDQRGYAPERGAIIVGDCALQSMAAPEPDPAGSPSQPDWKDWSEDKTADRMRVEIDDRTGRAEEGHLQFIESIAPSGNLLRFDGQIHLQAGLDKAVTDALRNAVRTIPAFGAFRTVGWGEHLGTLSVLEPANVSSPTFRASSDRLAVTVRFDRPVLVDARRVADNVFRGSAVIPGAPIKGALARALSGGEPALKGVLGDALSAVRISHAYPLDRKGQMLGRALPASLVAAYSDGGGVKVADMAMAPTVEAAPLFRNQPMVFTTDWKGPQFAAATRLLERSAEDMPGYLQRTRVNIDENGVAKDQNLFVFQPVRSRRDDGTAWHWRFEIDRKGVAESDWTTLIETLSEGLAGIGKTDAIMTVERIEPVEEPLAPGPVSRNDGTSLWVVTLETPSLMLDPEGPAQPLEGYEDYWRFALEDAGLAEAERVSLANVFAADRLAGGYLAQRYHRGSSYRPYWLTEPGSVFVLAAPQSLEGDLTKALARLHRNGLPPAPAQAGDRPDWASCPFLPEAGFGAFACLGEFHVRHDLLRQEGGEYV